MISLPSAYPAPILIAALTAALLFHLSRILGPQRLVYAAYAAAALGLIYLLGAAAFGWEFDGHGALFWAYLRFYLAGLSRRDGAMFGAIRLGGLRLSLGVVAYCSRIRMKAATDGGAILYFVEAWSGCGREEWGSCSRQCALPPPFCAAAASRLAEVSLPPRQLRSPICSSPRASNVGPVATRRAAGAADRKSAASGETAGARGPSHPRRRRAKRERERTDRSRASRGIRRPPRRKTAAIRRARGQFQPSPSAFMANKQMASDR
jgi:hypothetical protein